MSKPGQLSRRAMLGAALGAGALRFVPSQSFGQGRLPPPPVDITFLFAADIHACRMASGLSANCQEEGKTDENLLRHIIVAISIIRSILWFSFIAKFPIKATLVFLTFATWQNRRFCDAGNVCCWRARPSSALANFRSHPIPDADKGQFSTCALIRC
jgi:hypothetical protein